MWHWALLVVEIVETQVQVQLHKSSLVHLPFGRHEKEKGENINSCISVLSLSSPLFTYSLFISDL